jgi:hypothetical protein
MPFVLKLISDLLSKKQINTNTALLMAILYFAWTTDQGERKNSAAIHELNTHVLLIDQAMDTQLHIKIESPKLRGWDGQAAPGGATEPDTNDTVAVKEIEQNPD